MRKAVLSAPPKVAFSGALRNVPMIGSVPSFLKIVNESPIAGRNSPNGSGTSRALFSETVPVTFNWSCPFAPAVVPVILQT